MTRHELRERIFQTIFQIPFYEDDIPELDLNDEDSQTDVSVEDQSYINDKVSCIRERMTAIDSEIEKHSKGWKISRLGKTELAILRLAIYEIEYDDDIPAKVAVNEAVELAKVYADERSARFINGVLSGLL